jgi:hypothetical protein
MTIDRRRLALALGLCLAALSGRTPAIDSAPQVTMFAILATPRSAQVDPKLARIEAQLHKILPDHGFKLLDAQSKRLNVGESVACKLGGDDGVATAKLVQAADAQGKVRLRCELTRQKERRLDTLVTTPLDQLFFCDEKLPNGARLLIGIGAR